MQTNIGDKYIAKRAKTAIKPSTIVAYDATEFHVKAAGAGETRLFGISHRDAIYPGPAPSAQDGTQEGMMIDVATEGIVQCIFGAGTVAYGDPVKPDAQGRAVKANANDTAIGICDSPALEGYYGRVRIRTHKV
jgi:hypothetical protein